MLKSQELSDPNSCINKAQDDEMVFVLLARDPSAAYAIQAWVENRIQIGKNKPDDPKILEASQCLETMTSQRRSGRFEKK